MRQLLRKNWDRLVMGGVLLGALILFILSGKDTYLAVPDNLELFQAQYQMLKNTGTFFTRGASSPFLAGISRDVLPSEFSLTAILYLLFPALPAYLINFFLRIFIAVLSFGLLYRELAPQILKNPEAEKDPRFYELGRKLALLAGFCYGLSSLFPAYGISFCSIPLILYLLIRLYRENNRKKGAALLAGIFFYPLLSYFSYFGLFLLAYLCAAILWLFIRRLVLRKKGKPTGSGLFRLFPALVLLAAGYIVWENRLFGQMLFSDEPSIRGTIKIASLSLKEAWGFMADSFVNGMMHAEPAQKYLVLPVCLAAFLIVNLSYLRAKKGREIFGDLFNLAVLILVFNSLIYGLYYYEPFRKLFETLVPPLTGWQFNRTIFFSPFLWYASFAIALIRLAWMIRDKKWPELLKSLPAWLMLAAMLIVLAAPTQYNDLRLTAYARVYEWKTGGRMNNLSYGEFYSTELFDKIKEDLDYQEGTFSDAAVTGLNPEDLQGRMKASGADWSIAYGLYPAILEYNGIATLDGYLGFYSQAYKDDFRKVIAPALETNEGSRSYYDDWGARCYLYSGSGEVLVSPLRRYEPADRELQIDPEALRALGCRYLFSRIELTNAEKMQLILRGTYTDESSPYTIYVYELKMTADA